MIFWILIAFPYLGKRFHRIVGEKENSKQDEATSARAKFFTISQGNVFGFSVWNSDQIYLMALV